jgi:hypothetical protein
MNGATSLSQICRSLFWPFGLALGIGHTSKTGTAASRQYRQMAAVASGDAPRASTTATEPARRSRSNAQFIREGRPTAYALPPWVRSCS